eukprot:TRINITY_DN20731_c0_g1_i1.p1 TRINITY_DN20731_c0_g1~~TRINITY_DN20731_c0_g1_i1.p1  ORF type:complete len:327 (+),score=63.06 TRINITY_DN20731_c0_g1_i1:43-1023(+)
MIRRAAFDIGSGVTKLQVATLDSNHKIINVLYGEERPVKFALDLKSSKGNTLSKDIQKEGIRVLGDMLNIARRHGAQEYSAIATEVFRKASNGSEYVDRVKRDLGMNVQIISQADEAVYGYRTLLALSGRNENDNLIGWDSGGASFQIATVRDNKLETYVGSLGASVSTALCVTEVQNKEFKKDSTPNPVPLSDVDKLRTVLRSHLTPPPNWLKGEVYSVGGDNSIFCLAATLLSSDSFTPLDVEILIKVTANRTDDDLETICRYKGTTNMDPAALVVPKLTLLHTVMLYCGITKVTYLRAIGSCAGMLVTDSIFSDMPKGVTSRL